MAFFDDFQLEALVIERMAFHLVGPTERHFVLLDEVHPGRFADFFLDRIRSVNGGAEYTFSGDSQTRKSLRRIAADPRMFQEESENLAKEFQRLHRGTMAAGAFLVFVLRAGDEQVFALLKYDDETVLGYELKEGEGGRKRVELEALERTFVQNPAALQKSALIRLTEDGGRLVVIDRVNPQRVALYFENFLGAARVYDDAEATELIVEVARGAILKHRERVRPEVYSAGTQRTYDTAAAGGRIAVDGHLSFLEKVVGREISPEDPLAKTFDSGLKKARIHAVPFTLDPSRVSRPTTQRLVTVHNIQIIVPVGVKGLVEVLSDRIVINDELADQHDVADGGR
jgi:hypothetical protein